MRMPRSIALKEPSQIGHFGINTGQELTGVPQQEDGLLNKRAKMCCCAIGDR
jgi:hypothetical protein